MNLFPRESEGHGQFAALKRHDSHGGIHPLFDDLFGRFFGDLFDVHAAFRAGHDHRPRLIPIEQDGQVEFLVNPFGAGDEHRADGSSFGAGLFGDQDLAEHGARFFFEIRGGIAQVNPAFESAQECSFATAAGVNLRLKDEFFLALRQQLLGRLPRFIRSGAWVPIRNVYAVAGQQLFGLVFV